MKLTGLLSSGLVLLVLSVAASQEIQKVTITESEYKIEPKEITVKPGKVEFTLVNKGKDRHNLRLKMGDKDIRVGVGDGGQSVKAEVDLTPGEYEMFCAFTTGGSHKDKGMLGKLIVK